MGRTKGSKNKPGHSAGGKRPNAGRRKGHPGDIECAWPSCEKRFAPKGTDYRSHILSVHAESIDGVLNLVTETLLSAAGLETSPFKSTVDGLPLPPDHPLHPDNKAQKPVKMKPQPSEEPMQGVPSTEGSQQQQQQPSHEHEYTQPTEGDDHQFIAESAYTHGHDDLTHDGFGVHQAPGGPPSAGAPSAGANGEPQHDLSEFQHDLQQHLHHGGPSDLDGNLIAQVMASYREAELASQNGVAPPPPPSALSLDSSLGAGLMSILRRNGSSGAAHLGHHHHQHHHLYPSSGAHDGGMEAYVDNSAIDPSIDPSLAEPMAGPSGMAAFPPSIAPPPPSSSSSSAAQVHLGVGGEAEGSPLSSAADVPAPAAPSSSGGRPSTRKKPYDRPETPGGAAGSAREGSSTPRGPRKCRRCTQFDADGAALCPGRFIRANCNLNQRAADGKVLLPPGAATSSPIPGTPGWDPASSSFVTDPTSPLSHPSGSQPPPDASEVAGPSSSSVAGGGGAGGTTGGPVPNPLYVLPSTTGEPRKARHCKVCIYHGRDGKQCAGRGDRKKCAAYDPTEDAAGAYGRKKDGSAGAGGNQRGPASAAAGADDGSGIVPPTEDGSGMDGVAASSGVDPDAHVPEPVDSTTAYLADDDGSAGNEHGQVLDDHLANGVVDDGLQYVPLGSDNTHGHEMIDHHHHHHEPHHHPHHHHHHHHHHRAADHALADAMVDPAEEYVVGDQDDAGA